MSDRVRDFTIGRLTASYKWYKHCKDQCDDPEGTREALDKVLDVLEFLHQYDEAKEETSDRACPNADHCITDIPITLNHR